MKSARLIVLAVALGAGVLAFTMMKRTRAPEAVVTDTRAPIETVDVLVTARDVGLGKALTADDLTWRAWPKGNVPPQVITRDAQPDAMAKMVGGMARISLLEGEPVRTSRLVFGDGRGFMATIIHPGMRAIAIPVAEASGAGGFILPNDYVDVILTRRLEGRSTRQMGGLTHQSSTVLRNVRVLAIDQNADDRGRDRAYVGRTATLELSPDQAETLALSKELGTLSLTLIGLADVRENATEGGIRTARDENRLSVLKFGIERSGGGMP